MTDTKKAGRPSTRNIPIDQRTDKAAYSRVLAQLRKIDQRFAGFGRATIRLGNPADADVIAVALGDGYECTSKPVTGKRGKAAAWLTVTLKAAEPEGDAPGEGNQSQWR